MPYRIRSVVEMTGIPRNTLLAWERRYGVPTPDRTPGGHRVYADADVQVLRRLKLLIGKGHRISEAVALLRRSAEPERSRTDGLAPIEQQRDALRDALIDFDRQQADEIYHHLSAWPIRRVIDSVLMPVLREVGDGWHRGEISIAQEHFTSAFVREQLITMLNRLESGPVGGPVVVCAGYPGEAHEIGLLSIAVKLAMRGWRVAYLGADLPIEELAGVLNARGASLICQSVFTPRDAQELTLYAGKLLALVDSSTRIAFGGPGVAKLAPHSTDRLFFCPEFSDLVKRVSVQAL
ncbi:MAG: B12-binding domain-containing protein [Myxococcota bacterium]